MFRERELIPVTALPDIGSVDFNDHFDAMPPIAWGFNLPPTLDAERLVVDMRQLRRVQGVGAIASNIVNEYQGETTQFTPGVDRVSLDGSATATRAGVTTPAQRSKEHKIDQYERPTSDYLGKTIMLHDLNKSEIASRVADATGKKTREDRWAKELNSALVSSITTESKNHLLLRGPRFARYLDYVVLASWGIPWDVHDAMSGHPPLSIALFAAGHVLATRLFYTGSTSRGDGRGWLKDLRWSAFGCHQPDRYLALRGVLATAPIVRARK